MDEKETSPSKAVSTSMISFPSFNLPNLVPQSFRNYIEKFSDWRDRLGLTNPGTVEGIHKEVSTGVFLNNYAFSGMKAEVGRALSANPLFQVQHAFSAGSSQAPPWSFLSIYSTDDVHLPLFSLVFEPD